MAKLPRPPAALPPLEDGDVRIVAAGALLWRVYFAAGPHATTWAAFRHFGPVATARFDPHVPPPSDQDRGVLYGAERGPVCIAEVFQQTRVIDRGRRDPWLVAFRLARDVALLDLSGIWPTRAGASQAIASGRRDRAREWSRAIYEQYADVEGLWYPSSMHGGGACAAALYERAATALPESPSFHAPLLHPGLDPRLHNAARALGYRLL